MANPDTEKWDRLASWSETSPTTGSDWYEVLQDASDPDRFVLRRSGVACGWDIDECDEVRAADKKQRKLWEKKPALVRAAVQGGRKGAA